MTFTYHSLRLGLAALCLMAAMPASAQDATYKFSHPFAATHKQWQHGGGWMEQALQKDGGSPIRFEAYPASQLGKEHVSLIGSGLAHAGIVTPSYEPDKLPATSVVELPGMLSSSCEGSGKLWNILKEGELIDQLEMKPLGLVALYVNATPAYSILTTKKQVTALEDVKGLKLRAAGSAMDKAARAVQAVPISGSASELYDSLSRGTIDGSLMSIEAVSALGLEGIVTYAFDGVKIGSAVTVGVMNRRVWDGLSETEKDRLRTASLATQRHFCEWYDNAVVEATKALVDENKLTLINVSAEENARWDEALSHVAQNWAADLDKTGRRGSEILAAYQSASSDF